MSAPRAAAILLSVPLMAAACTNAKDPEPAYGAPEVVEPPAADSAAATPEPDEPTKADPTPPGEPQGEIYGTPASMRPDPDELEPKPKPAEEPPSEPLK